MDKKHKNKILLVALLVVMAFFITPVVFGAEFEVELPQVGPDGTVPEQGGGPIVWVNYIFLFGVALSGIAAVGSLIYAGILWMTSEQTGKIQEARSRIWAAILGLVIVAGSVIILRTINPDLVNLRQPSVKNSIFYQTYEYSELCKFNEYYDSLAEECNPRGEVGDECITNIQCLSSNCVSGACTQNNLIGQECTPINSQSTCLGDQYCGPTSKCINKGQNQNSSCALDIHCRSGECDLNTNTCKKGIGESCSIRITNDCAQNYTCNVRGLDAGNITGTCR